LNYDSEAARLGPPPIGIIDAHVHLRGAAAVAIYGGVAERFGISQSWSMTPLAEVPAVREVLGDRVRFIAQPDFSNPDRLHTMGDGFLEQIDAFHALGASIVKFWAAPRARDLADEAGQADLMNLDGPHRQMQMQRACDLGMAIMTHVGDPDTWFETTYANTMRYGSKRDQYAPLERMLDRFPVPWIAAHLGGWPENLSWLDGLLTRHPNLYLDTSATKWMVRTLSAHARPAFAAFVERWPGRILFGSDIVVQDAHLAASGDDTARSSQASTPVEARDLYASRYWALRTLFETDYNGPSPIADPDLHLIDPKTWGESDAPTLRGQCLSAPLLRMLYRSAAEGFLSQLGASLKQEASEVQVLQPLPPQLEDAKGCH
jgi:hypothetical protein